MKKARSRITETHPERPRHVFLVHMCFRVKTRDVEHRELIRTVLNIPLLVSVVVILRYRNSPPEMRLTVASATVLGLLTTVTSALASDVLDLTQGSFKGAVLNSDLALVE